MNAIYEDESDDSLMERAAGGNSSAFDGVVRRHQHRLQRFATRMLGGDSAKGADVAVGALLKLWEHRCAYRPSGRLGAWLVTTAYRMCLNELGVDRNQGAIDSEGMEVVDQSSEGMDIRVERTALAQAVRDAVMELPESHRAVLVLSTYEGMSYDAIAEVLEIPAGTVASRKNHALTMLRRRLASWH